MIPAFTLKTASTSEVVTLADLKSHLRVDHDDEDALIAGYAQAASQWVETYTGRSLSTQTWQLSMASIPRQVWLPRAAPLQTVTHVKYYDSTNVLTTLSATNYIVPAFHEPGMVELLDTATLPSVYSRSDAVQIEYVTGYAEGACPQQLAQAVQTLAAHFYEHREATVVFTINKEVEFAVTALCSPYRIWWRGPE